MDTTLSVSPNPHVLARFLARSTPGLPKYARLRDTLLAAIERGHWKPGEKLPTELELARATPFSLGTVQRALRALAEEGIVVRLQGNGTYVAEGRKPMDAPWHCRFLDDSRQGFLPIYPKVIARQRIRGRGPWSAHLAPDGGDVIRIDRVINVNDEFLVDSRFYLDAERFAKMLTRPAAELDGANLKIVISREFGLPVTQVAQTMSTVRFPDTVRRALKLRHAVTGTLLEIAASAGRDRPLYYQELYIPPNRRRLVMSDTLPGQTTTVGPRVK
jgi:DNA-binding GntR family transcriptional regulator